MATAPDSSGDEAELLTEPTSEAAEESYRLDLSPQQVARLRCGLRALWAALVCFSLLCFAVGVEFGSCEKGTPDLLFLATGLIMLAAVLAQLHFLRFGGSGRCTRLRFLLECCMGSAELLDFFTDGQQVAQAMLCDGEFHEAFVESWRQSSVAMLAGPVRALHLYGLLAMAIVVTLAAQLLVVVMLRDDMQLLANFLGLGGLQCLLQQGDATGKIATSLFRGITVGLLELVPGLYLQTSLFGLCFGKASGRAKAKQLLSLAVSGMGLLKFLGAAPAMLRQAGGVTCRYAPLCGLYFFFCAAILALLAVCALRVAHAYSCPGHLWNLTTGCVHP